MKKQYDVDGNKAIKLKKLSSTKKESKHRNSKFLMKNIKEFNEQEQLDPPLGRRRAPRSLFDDIFND
jgi:hypothetical protein